MNEEIKIQNGDPRIKKLLESIGLVDTSNQSTIYEPVVGHSDVAGIRIEFEFIAGQDVVAKFIFDNTDEGRAALKLFRDYLAENET